MHSGRRFGVPRKRALARCQDSVRKEKVWSMPPRPVATTVIVPRRSGPTTAGDTSIVGQRFREAHSKSHMKSRIVKQVRNISGKIKQVN